MTAKCTLSVSFYYCCRQEGVRGYYKGMSAAGLGIVPYVAANFTIYHSIRDTYVQKRAAFSRKFSGKERDTNDDSVGGMASMLLGGTAGGVCR